MSTAILERLDSELAQADADAATAYHDLRYRAVDDPTLTNAEIDAVLLAAGKSRKQLSADAALVVKRRELVERMAGEQELEDSNKRDYAKLTDIAKRREKFLAELAAEETPLRERIAETDGKLRRVERAKNELLVTAWPDIGERTTALVKKKKAVMEQKAILRTHLDNLQSDARMLQRAYNQDIKPGGGAMVTEGPSKNAIKLNTEMRDGRWRRLQTITTETIPETRQQIADLDREFAALDAEQQMIQAEALQA